MSVPEAEAIREPTRERRRSSGTEHEISLLVRPDVALHQTKENTARRHFVRFLFRVLSLGAADVVAAGSAVLVVRGIGGWLGTPTAGIALPAFGAIEFAGALIVALMLTGNYQRSDRPYSTLHLLIGSTLGVVVVCWSNFLAAPRLGLLLAGAILALITASALFLARGTVAALIAWALPDQRRLVPAVVVTATAEPEPILDSRSGYRVSGRIALDRWHPGPRLPELARMIREERVESIILLGLLDGPLFARVVELGLDAGCEVLCSPPGAGVAGLRPTVSWRGPHALIQLQPSSLKATQVFAKRCVDVAVSCVALALAAPLGVLIALAIRLESDGPVFFTQGRVGLGGRRFRMIKFRTMRVGADAEKVALAHLNPTGDRRAFKIPDDPRISRVGKVLRRWSLDELPQFLNVIAGQMSLVGPRPVPEDDFVDYEEHHFQRLRVKPGITGLWQVSGRSAVADFEERVRIDTEYIDRWSLWLDFKILLMTLPAVLQRTGAY